MMKRIIIYSLLFFTTVVSSWAQIPSSIQQSIDKANMGWQEFTPLTPQSSIFEGVQTSMIPNFLGSKIPGLENTEGAIGFVQKAIQGKYCADGSEKHIEYHMWIFRLDKNNTYNTFATSPRHKAGMVRLNGTMDMYRPGPNYCNTGELEKVNSGPFTLTVNFKTFVHTTPRNFQIMGKGEGTEDLFKNLRQMKQLYKNQLLPYLKYVNEYKSKPHITNIGGNGVAETVTVDTRQPVKAGTEDAEAGWKASRDGMGFLKNSLEAISNAVDFGEAVQTAVKVVGSGQKLGLKATQAVLGLVQSTANLVGVDFNLLNVASEAQLNATVDMMLRATAKAMEQYAEQDPAAAEINKKSKVGVENSQHYKPMIDASFMISALNDAFNQLDNLEQDFNEAGLQNDIVEGTIMGPGIYERLQMSFGVLPNAGTSTAISEQGLNNVPQMYSDLENMGYQIPDEIKNIDIQAKLAEAQAKLNSKGYDLDLTKPSLYFMSHTTSRIYFQGREAPNIWVYFQISSPDEYMDNGFINDNTIFQNNEEENPNENDDKPKPKTIYMAVNGNDANEGSAEAPLATLEKAVEKAETIQKEERKPVIILVAEGEYRQKVEVDVSKFKMGLVIAAQNEHQAIFMGSENISNTVQWLQNKGNGQWVATLPLHEDQWVYSVNATNPMQNPAPVISVNGKTLTHLPTLVPGINDLYSFGTEKVLVNPVTGVENLNMANVEVSTRKYAIKAEGNGNLEINGLGFMNYPYSTPSNTPGIEHSGNVQIKGCKFQ